MSAKLLHKHYKWELLALLCLSFFFHQGDRAIFGVVLSGIRGDLGLNDAELGLVGTVLFATLAVLMPFTGMIGDRFSKKWIITVSLIFWSAATLFTGFAGGLISLILLRSVATAGGEAFYAPAAYALIAQFHHRTRALAMSMHQGALYVGVMTSGFLGGWIADMHGWRAAFYVFGAGGILLGFIFIARLQDGPAENGEAAPPAGMDLIRGLGTLFRVPSAILFTIGFTAIVFVNNAFVVWAPAFLQDKAVLNQAQAGGYSMFVHHLPAFIGVLVGGALSDRWVLRRITARMELQMISMLCGVPAIFLMGIAPTLTGTLIAMAVFGLCRGLYEANSHAGLFDVIEPRRRGSAVAMMTMTAFLLGSLSPLLLGKCRDWFGQERGLSVGFAGLALAYLVGAIAVFAARAFFFDRDRISAEPPA